MWSLKLIKISGEKSFAQIRKIIIFHLIRSEEKLILRCVRVSERKGDEGRKKE